MQPEDRSAASVCDKPGCEKPMTGYDAWGEWCDDHNGGLEPIVDPRWWERTYAVPRWIVWLVASASVFALPRNIEIVVGWFS